MDSKLKPQSSVHRQAKANREVVTTPLFKLYQTNQHRLTATLARARSTVTWAELLDRPPRNETDCKLAHSPPICQPSASSLQAPVELTRSSRNLLIAAPS